MNFIPLQATEEQRANLKQLADYLASGELKAPFDMEDYTTMTNRGEGHCAAGQAPLAGIDKHVGEAWLRYVNRALVKAIKQDEYFITAADITDDFHYLFSYLWMKVDNTPEGTARRINYVLENGIPENWENQLLAVEPVSY